MSNTDDEIREIHHLTHTFRVRHAKLMISKQSSDVIRHKSDQLQEEVEQAIQAYIDEEVTKARIDELEQMSDAFDDNLDYAYPGDDGTMYDPDKYYQDRLKQLKEQTNE